MGFTIHEEIKTKLHFKDIALITAVFGGYLERNGSKVCPEQKKRMNRLVNRLGEELYDHPDNDKLNSH